MIRLDEGRQFFRGGIGVALPVGCNQSIITAEFCDFFRKLRFINLSLNKQGTCAAMLPPEPRDTKLLLFQRAADVNCRAQSAAVFLPLSPVGPATYSARSDIRHRTVLGPNLFGAGMSPDALIRHTVRV